MIYEDIQDYIDDNTAFDSLVLNNFRSIFSVYFIFMTLYLISFAFQKFSKQFVKSSKLRFKRTLRRFLRQNQVDANNVVVISETIELED